MTSASHHRAAILEPFLEVVDASLSEGCRDHLVAIVARVDAELVDAIAAGPELWALARELRAEAEAKLAALEADRRAVAAARAAGPARIVFAMRCRKADWLSEFRDQIVAADTATRRST